MKNKKMDITFCQETGTEWRMVMWEGQPTKYIVSNKGFLYDTERNIFCKFSQKWTNKKGQDKLYLFYNLKTKNGVKHAMVHTLVANAFLEKPTTNERWVVDHIDENQLNNAVENLQYLTVWENVKKSREWKKAQGTILSEN